jgi:hypothetical protein
MSKPAAYYKITLPDYPNYPNNLDCKSSNLIIKQLSRPIIYWRKMKHGLILSSRMIQFCTNEDLSLEKLTHVLDYGLVSPIIAFVFKLPSFIELLCCPTISDNFMGYLCSNQTLTAHMLQLIVDTMYRKVPFNSMSLFRDRSMYNLCANPKLTLPMLKCAIKTKGSLRERDCFSPCPLHKLFQNINLDLDMFKFALNNLPRVAEDLSVLDSDRCTPIHFLLLNHSDPLVASFIHELSIRQIPIPYPDDSIGLISDIGLRINNLIINNYSHTVLELIELNARFFELIQDENVSIEFVQSYINSPYYFSSMKTNIPERFHTPIPILKCGMRTKPINRLIYIEDDYDDQTY